MTTLEVGLNAWSMQSSYMRPRHHTQIYREAAEDARLAEELGFDVFWMGEHHHAYDGYLPSILQGASYLASATSNIILAAGVVILTLHSSARIAAASAAVQAVAPRRLRLAVGAGYWADEIAAHGLEEKERFAAFRGCLTDILGPELSDQMGPTQMWSAQTSEAGVKRAGRLGLGLYMASMGKDMFESWRDLYLSSFQPAQPGDKPNIHIYIEAWVDDDRRRCEWLKGRVEEMWRNYAINWLDAPDFYFGGERAVTFADRLRNRDQAAARITGGYIAGSAAEVADAVIPYLEGGADGVSFRVRFDGISPDDLRPCVERLAAEVVPQLRRAHAARGARDV